MHAVKEKCSRREIRLEPGSVPGVWELVLEIPTGRRSRKVRRYSIVYGMCIAERSKMTDREKAIIMAHTGVYTLAGDDFSIYHKYIEEIMERPVYTHELADKRVTDQIAEKSKGDFISICRKKEAESRMEPKAPVFQERDAVQAVDYADGTGEVRKIQYADWLCPVCGWFVGERYLPRIHSQQKSDYCSRCGQAIDWMKITKEEREAARKRTEELRKKNGFHFPGEGAER